MKMVFLNLCSANSKPDFGSESQTLVSDVFLVNSMLTVACNDCRLETETCNCIELHGCCTVSEASILE